MDFEGKQNDFLRELEKKFFEEYPEKKILYDQGGLVETDPKLIIELIPDKDRLASCIDIDRRGKLKKLLFETYPEAKITYERKMKEMSGTRRFLKYNTKIEK